MKFKVIIEAEYKISDEGLAEGVTPQDIADDYAAVFSGGGVTKAWQEFGYEPLDGSIEANAVVEVP